MNLADRIRYYSTHNVISFSNELILLRSLKQDLLARYHGWIGFDKVYLELEDRVKKYATESSKLEEKLLGMVERSILSPVPPMFRDVLTELGVENVNEIMLRVLEVFADVGYNPEELEELAYGNDYLQHASKSLDLAGEIGELRALLEAHVRALKTEDDFKANYRTLCDYVDRIRMTVHECHAIRVKEKIVINENEAAEAALKIAEVIPEKLEYLKDGYQDRQWYWTVDQFQFAFFNRLGIQDGLSKDEIDEHFIRAGLLSRDLHGNLSEVHPWVANPDREFRYFDQPWGDDLMTYAGLLQSWLKGSRDKQDLLDLFVWSGHEGEKVGITREAVETVLPLWKEAHRTLHETGFPALMKS